MQLIDGKRIAEEIREELRKGVEEAVAKGLRPPHLAAILVGEDGGSLTYVGHKMRACEQAGFRSSLFHLDASATQEALMQRVQACNEDPELDGFIVQLPLPAQLDAEAITHSMRPDKDVDGFHPVNMGLMTLGMPALLPATPSGIVELLRRYEIPTAGKRCVVLGRSNIVGRPVSVLLSSKGYPGDATVTVCHSRTPAADMIALCREADIIVAALGKPEFLTGDMVKEGVVVIDVGTTRVPDSSKKAGFVLKGDVHFDSVAARASYITPVPGGVGPMTVAMLLKNTFITWKQRTQPS